MFSKASSCSDFSDPSSLSSSTWAAVLEGLCVLGPASFLCLTVLAIGNWLLASNSSIVGGSAAGLRSFLLQSRLAW